MVGLGGILAEVTRDLSFRPAPINAEQAEEMLMELKGYWAVHRPDTAPKPRRF